MASDQYFEIPLEKIFWRTPIRREIRREDIQDMSVSFMCHGQIEPIIVKPPNEQGLYEGVVGRLRYEGAKFAKKSAILARIRRFKSDMEIREWQLAENLHRRDLTAIERAEAYRELYKSLKQELGGVHDKHIVFAIAKSQEDLTGEKPSESTIYDYMRVAELPEEVKKKITVDRNFGLEHGKQLLRLKDVPEKQLEVAEELADSFIRGEPLTVKQLKKRVDDIVAPKPPKPPLENIDTGFMFTCPRCNESYTIIHVKQGEHRFRKLG